MSDPLEGAIALLSADPADTLVCSDFDGTLARVVPDPLTARPEPGSIDALTGLAQAGVHVAVVSGRPVEFLLDRLGTGLAEVADLFGRYGAEHARPGVPFVPPVVDDAVRSAFGRLRQAVEIRSLEVRVEDKGGSLALHWREHPESGAAAIELARLAAAEGDLELREGKMMVDLVPRGAPDKGRAIEGMLDSVGVACFLGDDVGDLDAFDALDRFVDRGGRAVRVAVTSPEAPTELASRADLVLDDPGAAAGFLRGLFDAVRSGR